MLLFTVGLLMFFIGALGAGWLYGLKDKVTEVALWKILLTACLLVMGFFIVFGSSLHVNQGEPITTFTVGKEYTVLDSYISGDDAYLVLDDGSSSPRWYKVAWNKVPEADLYGRFYLVNTPTGQKFQFFH